MPGSVMDAIVLTEPGHLVMTSVPLPEDLLPGHALVRVHSVGVCGSDLHAYRGRQTMFT
jgi:threonine dehydrogenase-like Zn-dependent dehydrogenase